MFTQPLRATVPSAALEMRKVPREIFMSIGLILMDGAQGPHVLAEIFRHDSITLLTITRIRSYLTVLSILVASDNH